MGNGQLEDTPRGEEAREVAVTVIWQGAQVVTEYGDHCTNVKTAERTGLTRCGQRLSGGHRGIKSNFKISYLENYGKGSAVG